MLEGSRRVMYLAVPSFPSLKKNGRPGGIPQAIIAPAMGRHWLRGGTCPSRYSLNRGTLTLGETTALDCSHPDGRLAVLASIRASLGWLSHQHQAPRAAPGPHRRHTARPGILRAPQPAGTSPLSPVKVGGRHAKRGRLPSFQLAHHLTLPTHNSDPSSAKTTQSSPFSLSGGARSMAGETPSGVPAGAE